MKKVITIIGIFGFILVQAQVGINTDTPKATLDVKKNPNLEKTVPQGFILPKFTTAERTKFTDIEEGMMIYNTDPDKECVEIYTGIKSGVAQWNCMPGTASASAQGITVSPAGFEGTYIPYEDMIAANKVKFKLKNNSFSGITDEDFSGAVSIVNPGAVMGVASGENNKVSLAVGASTVLSYTLTGMPVRGTLTAKFNKLSLQADQSTQVGLGTATIADKTVYVVSTTRGATTMQVQGKINNLAEKLTIEIPYTQGQGSYNAFTDSQTAVAGQDGKTRNLKLDIPTGNFGVNGNLTATISVDNEYLVKQMAPGAEYTIATFPITMGGTSFNVVVKGIGGIPDRNFGNGTHDFLYLPVEVTGTYNVNGQPYKKIWLNMNLGAAYAKVGSPDFNVSVNKTGLAAHSDPKTYGSLFQWQRKADGHEFRNSANTTTLATSWAHTSTSFITTTSSNNYNWVDGGQNDTSGANVQLWQTKGSNNPCPEGYHIPTKNEWQNLHEAITGDRDSDRNFVFWNQSILPNFAAAGHRHFHAGSHHSAGGFGHYWASVNEADGRAHQLFFRKTYSDAATMPRVRSFGFSARCLKD